MMISRGYPWGFMKSGLDPPVTIIRTLDSLWEFRLSVSMTSCDKHVHCPGKREPDFPGGGFEPLQVRPKAKRLAGISPHEIKSTQAPENGQIGYGNHCLIRRNKLAVNIINIHDGCSWLSAFFAFEWQHGFDFFKQGFLKCDFEK